MGLEIGFFGFLVLVLDIWAIVSTIQSTASTLGKVFWIVLILILPILGFLLWLIFGPRTAKA